FRRVLFRSSGLHILILHSALLTSIRTANNRDVYPIAGVPRYGIRVFVRIIDNRSAAANGVRFPGTYRFPNGGVSAIPTQREKNGSDSQRENSTGRTFHSLPLIECISSNSDMVTTILITMNQKSSGNEIHGYTSLYAMIKLIQSVTNRMK